MENTTQLFPKENEPRRTRSSFLFIVFPVYLLKLIFLAAAVYCINSAGYLAIRDLRSELYAKAQTLPINHFVQEKRES